MRRVGSMTEWSDSLPESRSLGPIGSTPKRNPPNPQWDIPNTGAKRSFSITKELPDYLNPSEAWDAVFDIPRQAATTFMMGKQADRIERSGMVRPSGRGGMSTPLRTSLERIREAADSGEHPGYVFKMARLTGEGRRRSPAAGGWLTGLLNGGFTNAAANPAWQPTINPQQAAPRGGKPKSTIPVKPVPMSRIQRPPYIPASTVPVTRSQQPQPSTLPEFEPPQSWARRSPEEVQSYRVGMGIPTFEDIRSGSYEPSSGPTVIPPSGNLGSIVGSSTAEEPSKPAKKAGKKPTKKEAGETAPKSEKKGSPRRPHSPGEDLIG